MFIMLEMLLRGNFEFSVVVDVDVNKLPSRSIYNHCVSLIQRQFPSIVLASGNERNTFLVKRHTFGYRKT